MFCLGMGVKTTYAGDETRNAGRLSILDGFLSGDGVEIS